MKQNNDSYIVTITPEVIRQASEAVEIYKTGMVRLLFIRERLITRLLRDTTVVRWKWLRPTRVLAHEDHKCRQNVRGLWAFYYITGDLGTYMDRCSVLVKTSKFSDYTSPFHLSCEDAMHIKNAKQRVEKQLQRMLVAYKELKGRVE